MLQPGAHTCIEHTNISNSAALLGGGLCTDMADDAKAEGRARDYDLRTNITVKDVMFDNNMGMDIVAGPYFNLSFLTPEQVNQSSAGVTWRKRLCSLGEYLANSTGYCETCPAYTYSHERASPGMPGHERDRCDQASPNTHAPGGAVLVALTDHWHAAPHEDQDMRDPSCLDCAAWAGSTSHIMRCALGHFQNATVTASK